MSTPINDNIPSDGRYYLTTFGGGTDTQGTACGGPAADGSWFYTADSQRYRCGTVLRITNPANGHRCYAKVADAGPAAWVEQRAGGPILDASPQVALALFGVQSVGWSDHKIVIVEVIALPGDTTAPPLGRTSSVDPGTIPSGGGSGNLLALAFTTALAWFAAKRWGIL